MGEPTHASSEAVRTARESILARPREVLIDWVRKQLVGPPNRGESSQPDDPDLRNVLPTERFPCGALYPTSKWGDGIDPASEEADIDEGDQPSNDSDENAAEPAVVRRYIPPSSLGFSFFVKGEDIRFQLLFRSASYEQAARDDNTGRYKNEWSRKDLASAQGDQEEFITITCPGNNHRECFNRLSRKARIDVLWRRHGDGWIVTATLCNAQELSDAQKTGREHVEERARKTLFEASLRCVIDAGEVGDYPRVERSLLDDEEQEIELQYSQRRIYAIGHGCAADWTLKNGRVVELTSHTVPTVEVSRQTADTDSVAQPVLSIATLAELDSNHADTLPQLGLFIGNYAEWVSSRDAAIAELATEDKAAGQRIVERMKTAVARMRDGLCLLENDSQARSAFTLANRTMLNQMRQHDKTRGKNRPDAAYRWRPFQLAFLLTTLESAENEHSEFRDTVDLIWFPTGGGKTEAYLGLIAFQIVLRRLRHPDTGGGTTVLMRYTLRLLTKDQFLRAARLICALELLRRERSDLGTEVITIGMWVGRATSPNRFNDAAEQVQAAIGNNQVPELVIKQCPWCGTGFSARHNYDAGTQKFHFLCRNRHCEFGNSPDLFLPCNVVDEALYAEPPTMLVATVDKFARFAWEERANAFFGGQQHRPPELIIQDELHLIAGALGSVTGLYEAGLETVLQLRGVYPKYIASTATIRMADQQIKRLYGKDVAVFPPPGLDCEDSYFARTVPLSEQPGRIYIGYLAPLLNRQQCMAPLAAVLLLAPHYLFIDDDDKAQLLDAWWTHVVYHGSLKGVGNSHTAFASMVRDFMQLLMKESQENRAEIPEEIRQTPNIAQLTSRQTAQENSRIFAQLNNTREDPNCLDAVLATNMISVGLDVSRLASMIINGQPLTTAEYIQASSRVGRADVPGVVVANYYRDQARSLSHYESFRPYHEAFYRYVEPTSLTPYTYQARLRALHAALVIVMRHSRLGLLANNAAENFDPENSRVAEAIERFKQRCRCALSEHEQQKQQNEVMRHIDSLTEEWHSEAKRCRQSNKNLEYQVWDSDSGRDRLLYNHNDRIPGLWATLQSMRNVEDNALLKVL